MKPLVTIHRKGFGRDKGFTGFFLIESKPSRKGEGEGLVKGGGVLLGGVFGDQAADCRARIKCTFKFSGAVSNLT